MNLEIGLFNFRMGLFSVVTRTPLTNVNGQDSLPKMIFGVVISSLQLCKKFLISASPLDSLGVSVKSIVGYHVHVCDEHRFWLNFCVCNRFSAVSTRNNCNHNWQLPLLPSKSISIQSSLAAKFPINFVESLDGAITTTGGSCIVNCFWNNLKPSEVLHAHI